MVYYFHLFTVPNIPQQDSEVRKQFKQFFPNLNFFPSVPPAIDEHELRTQRISTRLFLFLLIILLVILLSYAWSIKITKTINVEKPSLTQYKQLYSTYSPTLTCPCTKTSISYDKFVRVEHTLHQVCSSLFVNQSWIKYLAAAAEASMFRGDFRQTGPHAFQALRAFCELSNGTIANSLIRFYSTQYVSVFVIPLHLFALETHSFIDQFRSSMTHTFLLSLSMIRDTTQANALFSGLQTNYASTIDNNKTYLNVYPVNYHDCNCASSSTCIYTSSIFNYTILTPVFNVPGFYAGCYVIESLLQSTLQCFYDQNCINELLTYWPVLPQIDVIALHSSLSNRYFPNSTIKELVDNLMIEQWNSSSVFERYYNECQPTQCTYIIETINAIYIVNTLIGLVGGLIIILQLLVPRLVKCILYCVRKRETSVVPEIPNVQT